MPKRTSSGAAAQAVGVGTGAWSDVLSACKTAIKGTGRTLPDSAQVEAYRKSCALFQELYPSLKASFERM